MFAKTKRQNKSLYEQIIQNRYYNTPSKKFNGLKGYGFIPQVDHLNFKSMSPLVSVSTSPPHTGDVDINLNLMSISQTKWRKPKSKFTPTETGSQNVYNLDIDHIIVESPRGFNYGKKAPESQLIKHRSNTKGSEARYSEEVTSKITRKRRTSEVDPIVIKSFEYHMEQTP